MVFPPTLELVILVLWEEQSYELREDLIVVPGTPVTLEARADIFDSQGVNDISSGDSFTLHLLGGINDAQAPGSLSLINVALQPSVMRGFSFQVR